MRKKLEMSQLLIGAHGKIVNQFSKNVLVDGVFDFQMLVLSETPIKTGPIRPEGKNFKTNVTWRNGLRVVPEKFNRISVSVPNNFVHVQNAVTWRVPKKINGMTVVLLIMWHQAFCDLYSKGLMQLEMTRG